MTNKNVIKNLSLLKQSLKMLEVRLRKTSNTQFEPNLSEKRRMNRSIKSMRRTISNLTHMI